MSILQTPAILAEMGHYASKHHIPICRASTQNLLIDLATEKQPKRILEIGTAIAYSTLLLAYSAPLADIVTIEKDPARTALAHDFIKRAGMQNRISLLEGDAADFLAELSGPFDFIFIDGPKAHYLEYLLKIKPNLSPGALILADNVGFRGMLLADVADVPRRFRTIVKRMKLFLDYVTGNSAFSTQILEIDDGVSVSHYNG